MLADADAADSGLSFTLAGTAPGSQRGRQRPRCSTAAPASSAGTAHPRGDYHGSFRQEDVAATAATPAPFRRCDHVAFELSRLGGFPPVRTLLAGKQARCRRRVAACATFSAGLRHPVQLRGGRLGRRLERGFRADGFPPARRAGHAGAGAGPRSNLLPGGPIRNGALPPAGVVPPARTLGGQQEVPASSGVVRHTARPRWRWATCRTAGYGRPRK